MRLHEAYDVVLGVGLVMVFLLVIGAILAYYKNYATDAQSEAQIEQAQSSVDLGIKIMIYVFIFVLGVVAIVLVVYALRKIGG